MLSIVILIITAAVMLCLGFLIGGAFTAVFAFISAAFATAALITAIYKRWKKND